MFQVHISSHLANLHIEQFIFRENRRDTPGDDPPGSAGDTPRSGWDDADDPRGSKWDDEGNSRADSYDDPRGGTGDDPPGGGEDW